MYKNEKMKYFSFMTRNKRNRKSQWYKD